MHFIFQFVYGLINNSSLNICLLKTILSVVFTDDKLGYWEKQVTFFLKATVSQTKCPKFIVCR